MSNDAEDVLEQALTWLDQGRKVALATVIETWGSAPRPVGAQLAVEHEGAFVGSVSGGCIEAAVIQAALDVMHGAAPRRLDFGVSNDDAWEVGLACGGRIAVFVEPLEPT